MFGCLSVLFAIQGNLLMASACIGASAVMDFFDGFVARLLKVSGELGKQLDSLADVVSFGVAPGFIFYSIASQAIDNWSVFMYLLIPVFSAIRLAKFNLDTRQSDSFIGLPTPANAMFIASIPLILNNDTYNLTPVFTNSAFLVMFPVVSAYLLIAELPLLALKFKNFTWKDNSFRFILIVGCVLSMLIFKFAGVAISILLYIGISIVHNIISKNTK